MQVTTTWKSEMAFDSLVDGHHIIVDADEKVGGNNLGPRPKPLLLTALTGCTGMDVVSILKKMRVKLDNFRVIAEAVSSDKHPKIFTKIHLVYEFSGRDLPGDKLKKAVDLSQERYCGISAMLKKSSELTYEIKIL